MASGQGPSGTDLATRRAESAAKTEGARTIVVERRLLRAAAAGAGKPCLELRFRERCDARWQKSSAANADRRIHTGMPGDSRGAKAQQPGSDRDSGRCNAGARHSRVPSLRQWPRVRGPGATEVAGEAGHGNVVHRTGKPLGEWVLR